MTRTDWPTYAENVELKARVASLEAEVLRLRASHARLMDATGRCDSVRCQEANDADDVPASAPTSGQGAAATAQPPAMVCDLEGDDTCACSTTGECRCVAEPVCSGPLVGSLIEPEFECAACGAQMTAGAAPAPAAQPATETCGTCDGNGSVVDEVCVTCSQDIHTTCPDCGGTGTTPRKEGP